MTQPSPSLLAGLQRHHIHVIAASNPFPTGRPDSVCLSLDTDAGPLAVKFFPSRERWETYDHMSKLWESSFGARRSPPGLPRPVAFLEEHGALVMERIDGRPMLERMGAGLERLDEIARALADLHQSDAQPGRRRNAKGVVRSIRRKAADLAGTDAGRSLAEVASRLEERLAEHRDVELVPSHGDFSPRNLLLAPERIVLIDWDRFTLADPVRDLAYFGAWAWLEDLRLGRQPGWALGDRLAALYQSYFPISPLAGRMAFYRAAGLSRIAHSQVVLWKSSQWAAALTAEALRLLS